MIDAVRYNISQWSSATPKPSRGAVLHWLLAIVSGRFACDRADRCGPGIATASLKSTFYPTVPTNQDRITSNVWITRGNHNGGHIFNIHDETGYAATSPAGTEWATYINNPTKTIAATKLQQSCIRRLDHRLWRTELAGTLPTWLLGGTWCHI